MKNSFRNHFDTKKSLQKVKCRYDTKKYKAIFRGVVC